MIEYKKSSVILVFNNAGKIALQLRSSVDDLFPSYWDFSAGGGVDDGENEEVSAKRELKEEIGVVADIEFVAKKHYKYPAWKPGVTRETDLFIYKAFHEGPFNPDLTEVEKVQFFELDTIQEMIDAGEKLHPELVLSWKDGVIRQAAGS